MAKTAVIEPPFSFEAPKRQYRAQGASGTYDAVEARLWLDRAIAQGVEEAQEDLDALPTEEIVPSRIPGATISSAL
jgi:hypothetical protein